MNQNEPKTPTEKNVIGKKIRQRKVFIMKAEGKTIDEMAQILGVSDSTIDRDLKSENIQIFTDELIRQQIIDLNEAKLPMRLHFRSDLLDKLLPKKSEQKIEGGETFRVEIIDNSQPNTNTQDTVPATSTTT